MKNKNQKTLITTKLPPFSNGQIHRPLTKWELADYAQKSVKSIEIAIDRGDLTAVRIGKHSFRFRPADIDRWMALDTVDPDEVGYFHGKRPDQIKREKEAAK